MRAYQLFGTGIDQLRLVDRPNPQPGAREVVVKMRAAALNARDVQIVAGVYPTTKDRPLVPLSDGVGIVVATGDQVTRVRQGDRVAGIFAQRWLDGPRDDSTWASTLGGDLDGVLQEAVLLHEDGVVKVPEHLTDAQAATLPTAGVSAWQALTASGGVAAGETVLVRSTGDVGLFALQFGRMLGARIIMTSRSADKLKRARALDASDVVDTSDPRWTDQVRELTGGAGADRVIDVTGDLESSVRCLKIDGTIIQIGYVARMRLEVDVVPLLLANARIQALSVGPRSAFIRMNRAIAANRLQPVIDRSVPFSDAAAAFSAFSDARRFGKIVVQF